MSVSRLVPAGYQQMANWQQGQFGIAQAPAPTTSSEASKEDLKARNRIAAKKWRDKKDERLYELESSNDILRKDALTLRNEVLALQTENQVLEDELRFFQTFMTKIMNGAPRHKQHEE